MKHLLNFKIFEKEEYTGKKETYRLKDIHLDKDGELVGTCKNCEKEIKVSDQEHFIKCKKDDK